LVALISAPRRPRLAEPSVGDSGNPALDELEKDLDTEEGDELEERGELDLASTECINQEHIALASTNEPDRLRN
jgi:hypothetical protein